jgi:hypothetical protein
MAHKMSRNPAVDFAPMKNESVLFQPQTNQFCLLNVTATLLWNQLDRPCTVSELAQTLCDHFDGINFTEAIRDVEQSVNELLSLNCLTASSPDGSGTSLDENQKQSPIPLESQPKPKYETSRVKVLTEQEVLSSFQVTAAGSTMWWM